jgi:2,5-diketo-D-gluconate reductase A
MTNNPHHVFNQSTPWTGSNLFEGHRALLAVQKAGGAKLVGASNYEVRDLQQIFDATGTWPDVLEIEVHPYWHEDSLIDFAVSKGITILSYAPLAKGAAFGLLEDAAVVAVAAAHGVTPAQAVLKWGLQRTGGAVLPRSTNSSHMTENLAVLEMAWELSPAEMASLSGLPQRPKIYSTSCYPWC